MALAKPYYPGFSIRISTVSNDESGIIFFRYFRPLTCNPLPITSDSYQLPFKTN